MQPEMEPTLSTDPAVLGILEELKRREPIFHRSEFGTTRTDFEAMMHAEFWEIGASGRRYSREYVLADLKDATSSPTKTCGRRASSTAAPWAPTSASSLTH
jgi:hypothetical protein